MTTVPIVTPGQDAAQKQSDWLERVQQAFQTSEHAVLGVGEQFGAGFLQQARQFSSEHFTPAGIQSALAWQQGNPQLPPAGTTTQGTPVEAPASTWQAPPPTTGSQAAGRTVAGVLGLGEDQSTYQLADQPAWMQAFQAIAPGEPTQAVGHAIEAAAPVAKSAITGVADTLAAPMRGLAGEAGGIGRGISLDEQVAAHQDIIRQAGQEYAAAGYHDRQATQLQQLIDTTQQHLADPQLDAGTRTGLQSELTNLQQQQQAALASKQVRLDAHSKLLDQATSELQSNPSLLERITSVQREETGAAGGGTRKLAAAQDELKQAQTSLDQLVAAGKDRRSSTFRAAQDRLNTAQSVLASVQRPVAAPQPASELDRLSQEYTVAQAHFKELQAANEDADAIKAANTQARALGRQLRQAQLSQTQSTQAGKPPYAMMPDEYAQAYQGRQAATLADRRVHGMIVQDAVANGLKVPDNVLAAYPDLAKPGRYAANNLTPEAGRGEAAEPRPVRASTAAVGGTGPTPPLPPTPLKTVADLPPSLPMSTGDKLLALWNIPRTLLTSPDFAISLRQGGIFALSHPQEWSEAFGDQMRVFARSFSNPAALRDLQSAIESMPSYQTMRDSRLHLQFRPADLASDFYPARGLVSRVPVLGKITIASNSAYDAMLDSLRAHIFDTILKSLDRSHAAYTPDTLSALAKYINVATGYGSLPSWGSTASKLLNAAFFAPRFAVSRFEFPLVAARVAIQEPALRGMLAKDVATFIGGRVALISALSTLGIARVTLDTNSSDFGKIRVGNLHYDVFSGFRPGIVTLSQMLSGRRQPVAANKGSQPQSQGDTFLRFVRSKVNVPEGVLWDLQQGKTYAGQKINFGSELSQVSMDISIKDVLDAMLSEGGNPLGTLAASSPAIFGVGTQAFSTSPARVPILRHVARVPVLHRP